MIDYHSTKVFVAGHQGLVGSALFRRLQRETGVKLITRSSRELDLRDSHQVDEFFASERPEYVFLAAATVGGIRANATKPADFIMNNTRIECNVILACAKYNIKKLLFLGSSCIYPKKVPLPIREQSLMTGPLEETNRAYAMAKLAGIEMCRACFYQYGLQSICAMPTSVYGPGDTFDIERSHVIPALFLKFHAAKKTSESVTLWGSGEPMREFIYADDLADALILAFSHFNNAEVVNIGVGYDITIKYLATLIADIVGYKDVINWDTSKPDGVTRKLLDTAKLSALGWKPPTPLVEGLERTYKWCLKMHPAFK